MSNWMEEEMLRSVMKTFACGENAVIISPRHLRILERHMASLCLQSPPS